MLHGDCTIIKTQAPTTLNELGKKAYSSAGDGRLDAFKAMNAGTAPDGFVPQGRSIILPLKSEFAPSSMSRSQMLATRLNSTGSSIYPKSAEVSSTSFGILDYAARPTGENSHFNDFFQAMEQGLDARAALIKQHIDQINVVAMKHMKEGKSIHSKEYKLAAEGLYDRLKKEIDSISDFSGKAAKESKGTLHALGIQTTLTQQRFNSPTGATELIGIPKAKKKVDHLVDKAVNAKKIIGLPVGRLVKSALKFAGPVGDAYEIYDAARTNGLKGGLRETQKQAYGMAGEAAGVALGSSIGAAVAIGLSVPTGGASVVVMGVFMMLGGYLGENLGESYVEFDANSSVNLIPASSSGAKPDSPPAP